MNLWNLIRDFFVENIFGGIASDYTNYNSNYLIGYGKYQGQNGRFTSAQYVVDVGGDIELCLGDYLSTTFTIITLILLVIVLYIFVKWIFKLFAGLLH